MTKLSLIPIRSRMTKTFVWGFRHWDFIGHLPLGFGIFYKTSLKRTASLARGNTVAAGFTLIELVMYVSVFLLMLFIAGMFILSLFQTNAYNRAEEILLESGSGAMQRMVREIHAASAIYTPTSVFSTTPGQLSITTSDSAPAGETTTYKDFFVSDEGRLCMHVEGQSTQCLTDPSTTVTNVRFVHLTPATGPDAVQIFLTLQYKSNDPNLQPTYSLQTTAQLRTY